MKKVLIWDSDELPPSGNCWTVLWRSYSDDETSKLVSIPRLVEQNSYKLRSRYLSWVYELGESSLDGLSLIQHLQIGQQFSYWWMTLIAEKCNYSKSPQIKDAIFLLAFIDWVSGRELVGIKIVTANQSLAECLSSWCDKAGLSFEWQQISKSTIPMSWMQRFHAVLSLNFQAWVWLIKYLVKRWPLKGVGLQAWCQAKGNVVFFSYLFNLKPESLRGGCFESGYWGSLPNVLQSEGHETRWLHLYIEHDLLPNTDKAGGVINSINKASQGMQCHVTLDTFLSIRVVLRAMYDFVTIAKKGRSLEDLIPSTFCEKLNLWPLFVDDWKQSTYGRTAIMNALNRSLFEVAMKSLPKQQIGFYLQENQGWEFALIQAWKTSNQGRLVGVPHSSIRFWDLRYFYDPRSYLHEKDNSMPLPDSVAVNGRAATEAYIVGRYPPRDLIQVEALRYLYLDNNHSQSVVDFPCMKQGLRLLVLGDYLLTNTQKQIQLLERAALLLAIDIQITVKPHPACPIQAEDYPEIKLTIVKEPLAKLFRECDVVYTSATTSAALDAYCAGKPVISMLDANSLNLSPLRGKAGVYFVTSSLELIALLNSPLITFQEREVVVAGDIFTIDTKLCLWRELINHSKQEKLKIGPCSLSSKPNLG